MAHVCLNESVWVRRARDSVQDVSCVWLLGPESASESDGARDTSNLDWAQSKSKFFLCVAIDKCHAFSPKELLPIQYFVSLRT